MNFKQMTTFSERLSESGRIKKKYPDRIPIICERQIGNNKYSQLYRIKYLVPNDFILAQFMFIIRKKIKVDQYDAIYFIINGNIPRTSELMINLYESNVDKDGFLYIKYTSENTFGNKN